MMSIEQVEEMAIEAQDELALIRVDVEALRMKIIGMATCEEE